MEERITTENKMVAVGVHKMLQPFVTKIVERTLDFKDREEQSRMLVSEIEDYSRHVSEATVMDLLNELTESGYELLKQKDLNWKVAGIVVLDCLLHLDDDVVGGGGQSNVHAVAVNVVQQNIVNNEQRRINIANQIRYVFQSDEMGLEAGNVVLREAALFIGHLARIASTVEMIDYLKTFYYPIAINMLTKENNHFPNLGGCLILKELAYNGPTMIYGKKKQIFLALTDAIFSKHHIVRDAASESLETFLLLVSQRESILDWYSSSLKLVDEGLASSKSERTIGALLLLDILVAGVVAPLSELGGIMKTLNRAVHVIIFNVLALRTSSDGDVRLKVIFIVPQLANAFNPTFTVANQYTNPVNFLQYTIDYLVDLIRAKQRMKGDRERPLAYIALGKIGQTMSAALRPANALSANPIVSNIVSVVREGLTRDQSFCIEALYCLGCIINAIPSSRSLVDTELLECMFRGGLTNELVDNLKIIFKLIPSKRVHIQSQLLTHVKSILRSYDVTLDHGPRSGRGEVSESLSGLLGGGATPKKKRSSFVNNITGRGRSESNDPNNKDRDSNNGRHDELDRFLSKSRFGIRATIRRGLFGTANQKDKVDHYNNNYTVGSIDVNRVDGGSLFFNEDATDVGNYTDNQLILALQVLASPDFFSGGLTATLTGTETVATAGATITGSSGTTMSAEAIVTSAAAAAGAGAGVGPSGSSGKVGDGMEASIDLGASTGSLSNGGLSTSDKSAATLSSKSMADGGLAVVDNTMLLAVVRDAVMRYLDDYNSNIRKAAVDTCASVLDTVVGTLDVRSESYDVFLYILNHLLMLGVGDDLEDIRCAVFSALRPSLDRHISESENLHCILCAANDEAYSVRESSVSLLSRIAHHDIVHILPELRVRLHMLLSHIQNTTIVISEDIADQKGVAVGNTALAGIAPGAVLVSEESHVKSRGALGLSLALYNLRLQSVQMLQAMIRSARDIFSPFADRILDILIPMLTDSSPAVARSALGTIAELSLASPESIHGYLDELIPLLISSLQDEKNMESQESAVEALGKMVDSLSSLLQAPIYTRYPRLFEGLVSIIQNSRASYELRLKAVKTSGLLGAVDADIYNEQMRLVKDKEKEKSTGIDDVAMEEEELIAKEAYFELEDGADAEKDELEPIEPSENLSNTDMVYFNVVIGKLIKIMRDSSLASHHLAASQVAVKILAIVGPPAQQTKCVGGLVDAFKYRLYQTERGNNLRSVMLSNLMTVVHVVGRGMRKHLTKIIQIINDFFFDHPRQSMDLLESIGVKLVSADFNIALRGVLSVILKTLREEPLDMLSILSNEAESVRNAGNVSALASSSRNFGGDPGTGTASITMTSTQSYSQPILFKTMCILQTLNNLGEVLGDDEKRIIIPALVRVFDTPNVALQADRKQVFITLLHLTNDSSLLEYANQLVLPLMRVINGTTATMHHSLPLLRTTLVALCTLACRLGTAFVPYIIPIRRNLNIMITNIEALDTGGDGKIAQKGTGAQDRHGHGQMDSVSGLSPAVRENLPQLMEYEIIISRLLSNRPIPMQPSECAEVKVTIDPRVRTRAAAARAQQEKFSPSFQTLEQAWQLSRAGRNSASDLEEWMHRLSNELIRQSPSPIIRACTSLSKAYNPLANELLTICVVCIWSFFFRAYSNDVVYENSLIQGIELALESTHIKNDMVHSLLQLAEFMDMQDKRLPIDVVLLARKSENANMYSKALRYRELQFNSVNIEPTSECVERLITVNNQLGSDDRALGVLEHVIKNFPHISVAPLWLEKLKKWDAAKALYIQNIAAQEESHPDEPPTRHNKWLSYEMGLLRCHHALGEFHALTNSAVRLRQHVVAEMNLAHSSHHHSTSLNHGNDSWLHQSDVVPELQRLGANASWNLGHWDEMESFLAIGASQQTAQGMLDPHLDWARVSTVMDVTHKTSFYRAVLAIRKEDFAGALELIEGTRASLVPIISSLLSEGYTRAYRSMITMQILSELEEVVQYKQDAGDILANANVNEEISALGDRNTASSERIGALGGSVLPSPGTKGAGVNTNRTGKRLSMAGADLYAPRSMQSENQLLFAEGGGTASPREGDPGNNVSVGIGAGASTTVGQASAAVERIAHNKSELMGKWRRRLKFLPQDVEVYRQVLEVHALVAEPREDLNTWLELVKLSRKEGMFTLCDNLLLRLGAPRDATIAGQTASVARSSQSISHPSFKGLISHSDTTDGGVKDKDGDRDGDGDRGRVRPNGSSIDGGDEGAFWEERGSMEEEPLTNHADLSTSTSTDGTTATNINTRRVSEMHWRETGGLQEEPASTASAGRLSTLGEESDDVDKDADSKWKAKEGRDEKQSSRKRSTGTGSISTSTSASTMTDRRVLFAAYKVMWSANQKTEALSKLEHFIETLPKHALLDASAGDDNLEKILHYASKDRAQSQSYKQQYHQQYQQQHQHQNHYSRRRAHGVSSAATESPFYFTAEDTSRREDIDFRVRCHLKRAEWMREIGDAPLSEVLECVMQARQVADDRYSVWHAWAVTNYAYVAVGERESLKASEKEDDNKNTTRRERISSNTHLSRTRSTDSAEEGSADGDDVDADDGGIFVDSELTLPVRNPASAIPGDMGVQESKNRETGAFSSPSQQANITDSSAVVSGTSSLASAHDRIRTLSRHGTGSGSGSGSGSGTGSGSGSGSTKNKKDKSGKTISGHLRNLAPVTSMSSSIMARKYSHHLTGAGSSANLASKGDFTNGDVGRYGGGAGETIDESGEGGTQADVTIYIMEAIKGFVRSIILGHGKAIAHVLQDTLRLLTLWFTYGTLPGVHHITSIEIEMVAPDTWLSVLPQLIARLHLPNPEIYSVLQKLLTKVGIHHPQALVCPISVARNTMNTQQKNIATHVLNEIRKQERQLVEEATMVSRELMRVAISPHELWRAGLDLALAQYVNKDGNMSHSSSVLHMVRTLTHMHEAMEEHDNTNTNTNTTLSSAGGAATVGNSNNSNTMSASSSRPGGKRATSEDADDGFAESSGNIGSVTLRDISFRHSYGRQLAEAKDLLLRFAKTGLTVLLHQLWNIYQEIIRRMDKSLAQQKKMQLHHVSRELTNSRDLRLAVPGTYKPGEEVVSISTFVNTLSVISSKQRPRRMGMIGSDGQTYEFLLKGKEDLRQDERVMQLFGLINACLESSRDTNRQGLKIVQYSVLPLSNNSGVIGWLRNCDTFNALLSQYRAECNVPYQLEIKLLHAKLGSSMHAQKRYDSLPDIAKVEVFRSILEQTEGADLEKMLWRRSRTADAWVGRRDSFTCSLAVMSIVGYILGLGDRHMANIMLDRVTGRVIHIDFGDCFEVLKFRSMYPETIPFRLTRMLTKAMGTSGMAGTFKYTSYRVMRVLREHRDSVMAMLEAFVYDPMVSWRVLANNDDGATTNAGAGAGAGAGAPPNQDMNGGSEASKGAATEIKTEGTLGTSEDGFTTATATTMTLSASMSQAATARNAPHQMAWPAPGMNAMTMTMTHTEDQTLRNSLIQAMSISSQGTAALLREQQYGRHFDGDERTPILESSLSHAARESMSRRDSLTSTQLPLGVGGGVGQQTQVNLPMPTLTPSGMTPSRSHQDLSMMQDQASQAKSMSATLSVSGTLDGHSQSHIPPGEGEQVESVNARALEVITRIHSKLTGRDFVTGTDAWEGGDDEELSLNHERQVDRLIAEATSVENLCKLYWGWNPWW